MKAPLLPYALTLQLGGGTVSCGTDCNMLDLVTGPAFKVNVHAPGLRIEPWVMPRVHVSRTSFRGESVLQPGFGVSLGVNLSIPSGFGMHAVLDFADFSRSTSGSLTVPKASPYTGGIGIHYKIAVPSLGMPLMPVVN